MDLVELYQRSVDGFAGRVGEIRPDQWTAATPCPDWDVRALVNHVVSEQLWAVPLFRGGTIAEVGDKFDGDVLGTEPVRAATEAAAAARDVVTEPGVIAGTVHLSFGDVPAEEYLRQLLADHLVHSWDLSVAIGADRSLDPGAVHECAAWFAGVESMYRDGGAVGPRVPVPDGAGEQDRLIAAFGRDPAAG